MAGGIQAGTAWIPVRADMSRFGTEVEQGAKGATGKLKNAAKIVGGAFALNIGKDLLTDALGGARESQALANQTAQAIKTTGGAANVTADQVGDLSSALSKKTAVDDEVIQSGANLLLTFKNVKNVVGEGNDIFDQTVALGNDMSVALGQDMKSSALQLGKALNDPIKGVSALQRVGVSFTGEQKEQIKTMVEAGDTMGAQKLILGELEDQFGGSAAAQADASKKASVAWGNFQEMIGGLLIPVVDKLLGILSKVTDWATENPGKVKAVAIVIGGLLVLAFTAWAASAIAAAAATTWAMLPVIAIGVAIGALIAAIIWAYNEWDVFRNVVQAVAGFLTGTVWPIIKEGARIFTQVVIPAIKRVIEFYWNFYKAVFDVVGRVVGKLGEIVSFMVRLPGRVSSAASRVFSGLKDAAETAVRFVLRWLDKLLGPLDEIGGKIGGVVGKVAGVVGKIPGFAGGVSNFSGGLAWVGENGPELVNLPRGSDVIPTGASMSLLGGGGSSLEGLKLVVDGREFGRLMRDDDWRYGLENGS